MDVNNNPWITKLFSQDAQQYASELKELQRTLDHDEKLKDFLFHKSNDRVFASQFEDDEKEKVFEYSDDQFLEGVSYKVGLSYAGISRALSRLD